MVYRAKDGSEEKVFDALEWLAAMCSHIPDRGEQMVRYYGYYSNVSRGKRKETDGGIPSILEADKSSKEYRKNWARLIQKIYEVDPLTCPKCGGIMRILAFIEDQGVIKAILKHLGLWLVKSKPTPKAHAPPAGYIVDHLSQLPRNDDHLHPAKRGTTPGTLTFSRKQGWGVGGGRNRCAWMNLKTARGASPKG